MLTKIKAVRVQEIIMSGSTSVIGTIKYSGLLAGKPRNTKRLPSAKPLFYSFSQSIILKRQYEIDNDFKYDIVIK